ncbi:MAG: hypothetical protein VXA09_00395 [Burkholderiaceae bacterium]
MSQSAGIDHKDKLAWCEEGERREREFVGNHDITGWGISMNPAKQKDKFTHDFLGTVPMDLKSIDTQWRDSQAMFGIPPEYAISINLIDLQRYRKKCPNIVLVLDVLWAGVYTLTIPRAQALQKAGKAKPHQYEQRKNDTKGNSKVSLIFDLRDLDEVVCGGE